jgi:hypothetical protein
MLTIDYSRWDQDLDILRVLGLNAEHPRTRERFLGYCHIWTHPRLQGCFDVLATNRLQSYIRP